MAGVRWFLSTLLVALVLVCGAEHDFRPGYTTFSAPYITDEETCSRKCQKTKYIRHIHSMFDAYRGDVGGRLVIETNALIDTKYRTWKRNADIINSLLALPKGMNDAGR